MTINDVCYIYIIYETASLKSGGCTDELCIKASILAAVQTSWHFGGRGTYAHTYIITYVSIEYLLIDLYTYMHVQTKYVLTYITNT